MTYLTTSDGPYIIFTWILLAKFRVNPVIWWKSGERFWSSLADVWLHCCRRTCPTYRFHIQEGFMVFRMRVEAHHTLPQYITAKEEVRERDVDGCAYFQRRKHMSSSDGGAGHSETLSQQKDKYTWPCWQTLSSRTPAKVQFFVVCMFLQKHLLSGLTTGEASVDGRRE